MDSDNEEVKEPLVSKHNTLGSTTNGVSNRPLSPQNPVKVIQCTAMARSTGKQCTRWSLRGSNVCPKHGGQLPTVKAHAAALVEAARLRLIGMSDQAVDVLEDLSLGATAEQVRLRAAESILDRSGIRAGSDVFVATEDTRTESAADRLSRQLEETSNRLEQARKRIEEAKQAEDVVDAEIVDDEED